MNVAIYVRVSKDDGSQDEANQEPDCLQLCRARGWRDPIIFPERQSGAKDRPVWRQLLDHARTGACNAIVVWSLDRVGRSMWSIIDDVRQLHRHGCQLVSVRDPWLDTGGPTSALLLAIFAWVADYERARMIERTKAGMARARAEGKHVGRPEKWVDPVRLQVLIGRGVTIPEISRRFNVSERTLANHLARARAAAAAKRGVVYSGPKSGRGRGPHRPD